MDMNIVLPPTYTGDMFYSSVATFITFDIFVVLIGFFKALQLFESVTDLLKDNSFRFSFVPFILFDDLPFGTGDNMSWGVDPWLTFMASLQSFLSNSFIMLSVFTALAIISLFLLFRFLRRVVIPQKMKGIR